MANETYRAKERLYLDATRQRVLPHGHPDAAYLLIGAGGELPFSIAQKYKLPERDKEKGEKMDEQTKAQEKPEKVKAVLEPPKNKSISQPEKSK